nr:DeoR family transcriptional regulator [Pseudochelatococcus lubricantis]
MKCSTAGTALPCFVKGGKNRKLGSAKLSIARQRNILSLISGRESIVAEDLAGRFGIFQETIRRDIRTLKETGQVRCVHGAGEVSMPDANIRSNSAMNTLSMITNSL